MISAIDEQISHLSNRVTTEKSIYTLKLKDEIIIEELKRLHNKSVVVPIEKARGNIASVWQSHYTQVLIKELDLNYVNNINSTYAKANKPLDKIASVTTSFL